MLGLWEYFWPPNWGGAAPAPPTPPDILLKPTVVAVAVRRLGDRKVQKVALSFTDPDPNKARLHRDLVDRMNDFAGVEHEVATPATANTEFSVRHALGKVPTEYQVLANDAAGLLYRSSPGKWTETHAFFKYSAAGGASVRVKVRFR